jgi:hypothetical protein
LGGGGALRTTTPGVLTVTRPGRPRTVHPTAKRPNTETVIKIAPPVDTRFLTVFLSIGSPFLVVFSIPLLARLFFCSALYRYFKTRIF